MDPGGDRWENLGRPPLRRATIWSGTFNNMKWNFWFVHQRWFISRPLRHTYWNLVLAVSFCQCNYLININHHWKPKYYSSALQNMFRHKMFEPIHLTVLYLVTDFYALASYYYLTLWMPIMLTILKKYTLHNKKKNCNSNNLLQKTSKVTDLKINAYIRGVHQHT